ncbi:MAG: hypothetical protein EXR70_08695 [Deltaproteobacteria bacterium]|nr:hypothetical protein [Deltaproteobacteria bacterium]
MMNPLPRLRRSVPLSALALLFLFAPGSSFVSAQQTKSASNSAPLKALKVEPVKGYVGASFTISAEGLAAGKKVEFFWTTVDAQYLTKVLVDNVEYHERNYDEKRVSLGSATVDGQGRVSLKLTAPEDFGEVHDIHGAIDGQDLVRGGFRILRSAAITPSEGPVGTPIVVTVHGMGWRGFEQFMGLRYDNKYTGEISAVTTKGSATFQIRAAGPAGKHVIQLNNSTAYAPGAYLNTQQSPQAYIYSHLGNQQEFRFTFNVTKDAGPPPNKLDWPEATRVAKLSADAARTTMSMKPVAPGSIQLSPTSGAVHTKTVMNAKGLPPSSEVGLHFVTARGNRMTPSGWNLDNVALTTATTKADGTLTTNLQIPDDLGGWHVVKLVAHDRVLAEVPFYVEQSLVKVNPRRVKVGEPFTIQIKGSGWTELDNTVAVTYDNAAMGYACGFNSNGDITINLVASGAPGTHLIDLYPAIYKGKDRVPWNYQTPFLTYARDFPALALGYKLPAYRIAIEVVP